MRTLQEKVKSLLDEYAEAVNREVIVSHEFANLGTFHLLDENGEHVRQSDFRFAINQVQFEMREPHSYQYKHRFEVGEEWLKLLAYLQAFVTK